MVSIYDKMIDDQKNMFREKTAELVNEGYNEEEFGEDYWTKQVGTVPRYMRGSIHIINYMKDLWEKLGVKDPGSLIDICAGAGNTVNEFRQHKIDAYGCEFSAAGRKVAKDKFNLDIDQCDLRTPLRYYPNQFNWGTCIAAISMIPRKDMASAISEICRVTKYGIFLHVATAAGEIQNGAMINPHHLTGMSHKEYANIFKDIGMNDLTDFHCASDKKYGIGVNSEFTRLYSKFSLEELKAKFS